jgi:hypothetical protein
VFSYRTAQGDFRIARRGGGWFIECNGETIGTFMSPAAAALALHECELMWPAASHPPSDIRKWTRGDQPRKSL